MSDRHAIEHYYERNTRRFLLFGGGTSEILRGVIAKTVSERSER